MLNVLLSNDDGIFAPGLAALAAAFLADGWRVFVCAPDGERSGASHGIVIARPIIAAPVVLEGFGEAVPAFKCDGLPGDCVRLALLELCTERPDMVVAGVNDGWNVGKDVHYSGTFGAAMEAAFCGVPSIAVSAQHPSPAQYQYAAELAARLARKLVKDPLPLPSVLNVNIPKCDAGQIQGLVEAPLTNFRYTDYHTKLEHTRGRTAYWLRGDIVRESATPGGDLDCLLRGYATVTAVGWDMTMLGACGRVLGDA